MQNKTTGIVKQKKRISSAGPSITQKEIDLVTQAVTDGWYENMDKYIQEFIQSFSSYLGIKYCLPTAHCTDAIHLALLSLGVGPGDEVIVPDITWVASAAPITYVGAQPIFVDIAEDSWCMSPESFERAITKKTKAVIVVDLLGNMPEWDTIKQIANKYRIVIIEDAAEGIGAKYESRQAGCFGRVSLFSFNATKLIISGQGGMFCTDDELLYEHSKRLSHHGISKQPGGKYYWSEEIGYNYNWTNIQAALVLAQLQRIDELLDKKTQIFSWYYERLKDVDGIVLNNCNEKVSPTYWLSVAIINSKYGLNKELLGNRLDEYAIDARPFFYPISSMPAFSKYCADKNMIKENPVSYNISPYGICLPSGNNISEDDAEYVCEALKEILKNSKN